MVKRFLTRKEVAELLRIKERTLATYGSDHEIYRADRAGLYYVEHVEILEKVWGKIITRDEGLALWQYRKLVMRKCLKVAATDVKSRRKGKKAS